MAWQGKVLAAMFCLLAQMIAMVPAATPVEPTLVWDGDRVVDGQESYFGEVILLEGNLTVTGALTFENTELILAQTQNGSCDVTVKSGGNLSVLAGSVIRSSDPKAHFTFKVLSGGSLWMNGSRLSDCGWDDLGNGTHHAENLRGLYLASSNATVTNSELSENGFGLIIDGTCSPLIQNNNISQNDADGIRVLGGATPLIDHNTIVGNALIYPWWFSSWAGIGSEASSPRISNNTLGTVRIQGWTYPRNGITLGGGGSPVVEDNLVMGFDGDGGTFYGLLVDGGTNARISRNHFSGDLTAINIAGGRSVVSDNLIQRGTQVSTMYSYGIMDRTLSVYSNNTITGFTGGVLVESSPGAIFDNITVLDCAIGVDAYSVPGATFTVTVINSTLARNFIDAQATNPHFGPGGTLTLVNPSYDSSEVAAPGGSEKLVVAWHCRADASFESDSRPASGALMNFTDAGGALAAQSFAGPNGSAGPFALPEFVLSGGVRTVKTPYAVSAASGRWTNRTVAQIDHQLNVTVTLDDIPPWILVQTPGNGTLTNASSVRVSGTCEPGAAVNVSGLRAQVTADGHWNVVVPLEEGENIIIAEATDRGNNAAPAAITVISDTARPDLVLYTPKDGLLTNNPYLNVTGSAPDRSATLKVNGATVPCGPDGAFSAEVELFEGENHIIIECRDAAGNLNSISHLVTLDTAAPELVITDPENGTLTREPALTLSGRAEAGSVVTVNGGPVNLNGGGFLIHGTLAEGENVFVFQSRDRAGNTATASVTVRLDTIAPVITVLAPSDGSLLNRSTVEVRGTVEPGATVKVQGAKVVFQGTEFGVNLTIPAQGPYTITIEARDAARNVAETSLTVTLDTVAPALKLTGPAAGTVTNQSAIKITGKSEAGASVRLGGKMVVADQKGAFCFTAALPAEGKNVLIVEAVDRAGNRAELALEVFRDTVLTYNVTPPAERTRAGTVLIRGMAEPGSTVTVAGRALALAGDGAFAAEVPLETGPNEIRVTVQDRAGNRGETVLEVTREKPAATTSTPGFEALWMVAGLGLVLAIWYRKRK